MAFIGKRIKELDTIDLTGDEPVYKKKTIHETVPVVALDGESIQEDNVLLAEKKKAKCDVCSEEESKYTCPGCNVKTCCLACVKKHKKVTDCSGERDKAEFVAKSKFDNFTLLSDYRLLEEANRLADNARRDYKSKPNIKPGKQNIILQKAAAKHGVKLLRMAKGMHRWKENKSRFHIKENIIYWTVKLIFPEINEEVLTKSPDTDSLELILSEYIDKEKASPENKIRFSKFPNGDAILLFKNELDPGPENHRYAEVGLTNTLRESLSGRAVLEYPVYYVVSRRVADKMLQEPFVQEPELN